MSRLLFAAARGARIDWYSAPHEKWCASAVVSFDNRAPQRIHPDDAHLAYGPISTALRICGMGGDDPYTLSSLLALNAYMYESPEPCDSALHLSLFLLILAEALADEGL